MWNIDVIIFILSLIPVICLFKVHKQLQVRLRSTVEMNVWSSELCNWAYDSTPQLLLWRRLSEDLDGLPDRSTLDDFWGWLGWGRPQVTSLSQYAKEVAEVGGHMTLSLGNSTQEAVSKLQILHNELGSLVYFALTQARDIENEKTNLVSKLIIQLASIVVRLS